MKRDAFFFFAIGALLVIVLGLAIVIKTGVFEHVEPNTSSNTKDDNGTANQSYSYLLPDAWSSIDHAQKDIQSLGDGQRIEFGIVQDPQEKNLAYFATSQYDTETQRVVNSVYRYHTDDYTFERIYKETDTEGSIKGLHESAIPFFHVLGFDNGKIIILAEDMNDSPGPCTEPWTLGYEESDKAREMLSLNIQDPYAHGLEPYKIPKELYAAAFVKQLECVP